MYRFNYIHINCKNVLSPDEDSIYITIRLFDYLILVIILCYVFVKISFDENFFFATIKIKLP